MSDTALCLKPINDLLTERFFIPSYQRGYRWSPRQVTDLLDDILTFQRESDTTAKEAFYCLQPVVVTKRPAGEWEVIDGQQRLTTVFLILTVLQPLLNILRKTRYSLHYETREDSGTFLQHIDLSRMNDNIDYYHICSAYQTIEQWFARRDGNDQLLFLQCLLNSDDAGKNVKVIWYELPNGENPVDVFIRLNIGKIPLTNAELIRALFLRSRNFRGNTELRQLQIAQEWDGIEKILQADDFWYFIHKGDVSYPTRIEYLFWLITEETESASDLTRDDDYYTFIAYSRRFTADVDLEWLKVKRYFMTCEEWYHDRALYHLIGYLITEGIPILDLIRAASESSTKRAFRQALKRKVFTWLFGDTPTTSMNTDTLKTTISDTLADLNYEDDKNTIRSVLLLFNIATLLQNSASNLRFPFDSYKKESWDIEHIRSVKSDKPGRVDAQKQWLRNVLEYWTGNSEAEAQQPNDSEESALCKDIIALLDAATFDSAMFDTLYDKILACFEENGSGETDHSLANLALLDFRTNRSYKNAVFPIKRRHILWLDKAGTFVPLCTTNVFLKYYSNKIKNMMFWTENDRKTYFDAIVDTLVEFFAPENGGKA